MIVKFIVSVGVFTIWMISGIAIMLGGMFIYEQDTAWWAAVAVCVIFAYAVGYFGRWLYRKFRLGVQVYWVVAIFILLFSLIIMPDSPIIEFLAGVLAAVIFAVLGIVEYKKSGNRSEDAEVPENSAPTKFITETNTNALTAKHYVSHLESLSKIINDSYVRSRVIHLQTVGKQILDFTDSNPDNAHKADMFKEYYLPKTVKLIEKYAVFSQQAIKSENMQSSMVRISESLVNMEKIFEHCLNSLYSDIALDISVDIDVLEQMMNLEGVGTDSSTKLS